MSYKINNKTTNYILRKTFKLDTFFVQIFQDINITVGGGWTQGSRATQGA